MIGFQGEQVSIIVITLLLLVFFFRLNRQLKAHEAGARTNRTVALVIRYVTWIYNYTVTSMGPDYGPRFAAYIGSLFLYLLTANLSGLVGLPAPTANYSVTLMLAIITWLAIQVVSIRTQGIKGYLHSFLEPFSFFLIPNLFSQIAPLISMSLRLFGNIVSGSVIMSLIYSFTGWLSGKLPVLGDLNLLGAIVAPILHLYFDLFSGFLQAFIFISLTMIFVGVEAPKFSKHDVKTIQLTDTIQ